jgi:hypothetical protein
MNVLFLLQNLERYARSHNYAGYDPYDALNSPLVRVLTGRSRFLRQAAIQVLRRLPINLRPVLGIRKGHNPKALGLFLWGYAKLYRLTGDDCYAERVDHLITVLERCRSQGCSGNGWGYNFDWQSRAFYIPKFTPTIVNSSFIGHALLDAHAFTGRQKALDLAVPIKDFILNDLHRTQEGETFCFGYTPLDGTIVHNANLLGASLLARLFRHTGDEALKDAALRSMAYSMKYQRPDGGWYYADTPIQRWIDSFHTGFNLQAVRYILTAGLGTEYKPGFRKGVDFYRRNFFLADGTPKYYHDKVYPLDIHCPAQAIVFFSECGPEGLELAEKVAAWTVRNLYDRRGFFYFRRGRLLANRIPYMRWSQAWAFHGLTALMLAQSGADVCQAGWGARQLGGSGEANGSS